MDRDASTDLPLVSVLIVTRNRETLFARAIQSVVEQDYRPIEIIVLDNASTSPVKDLNLPADISVSIIRNEVPQSASASRNHAAEHAQGAYLAFLDDDDFYLPGKFAEQIEKLESNPAADFCVADVELRFPGRTTLMHVNDTQNIADIMRYRPLHVNGLVIRKTIFAKERFDERLKKYVDVHLFFRLFRDWTPSKIDKSVAVWMFDNRADQMTDSSLLGKLRNVRTKRENWKFLCDDFSDIINQHRHLRTFYYGKQSIFSIATLRPIDAIKYGLAALSLRDHRAP